MRLMGITGPRSTASDGREVFVVTVRTGNEEMNARKRKSPQSTRSDG